MATLTPHIERYVTQRREAGEFTAYTAQQVTYVLADLAEAHGRRPLNQFGPATLDRWQRSIAGNAAATRALYTSHVRSFCRWLHIRDVVRRDPSRALAPVPQQRQAIVTFTCEEMEHLLAAAPDLRARAILELMYGAGARCVEVSRLLVQEFDPRSKEVLLHGKRLKERTVPLDSPTVDAVEAYLDSVGRVRGPLVRSEVTITRGLGSKTISIYTRRWIAEAGLKHRPWDGRSPHAIRRTAVSEVAESAHDLREAQEFAGHSSVRTTEEHYARRVVAEKVRVAVEGRERGRAA